MVRRDGRRQLRRQQHPQPHRAPRRSAPSGRRRSGPGPAVRRRASDGCGPGSTTRCSRSGTRCSSPRSPKRRRPRAATTGSTPPAPTASSSCASCAAPTAGGCGPGKRITARTRSRSRPTTPRWSRPSPGWRRRPARRAGFSPRIDTADALLELFWDEDGGGLFTIGSDGEQLITRSKDLLDNATPSANSMAAVGLIRLAALDRRRALPRAGRGHRAAARQRRGPASHRVRPSARGGRPARRRRHRDRGGRRP